MPDSAASVSAVGQAEVTVRGVGSAMVSVDAALVELACESVADRPDQALSAASAALADVRLALRGAGVPDAAVWSTVFGLWPEPDPTGRPGAYRAELGLSARVAVAGLGALLADVVRAGGDAARLRGVRFAAVDPQARTAAAAAARDAAWADALAGAEQLARLAGRPLGPVRDVRDGPDARSGPAGPRAMAGSVPVDAGERDVRHELTVTWELA